jgi:hypothetical protein
VLVPAEAALVPAVELAGAVEFVAKVVLAAPVVLAAAVVPVAAVVPAATGVPVAEVVAAVDGVLAAWTSACSKLANKVMPCSLPPPPSESPSPPPRREYLSGLNTVDRLVGLEAEMALVDIILSVRDGALNIYRRPASDL